MSWKIALIAILTQQFLCQSTFAKIVPIIDEKYEDCLESGSAQILDLSKLKLIHKGDNYFINGT